MTCATNPSVKQQFPNLDDSNHSETSPRSPRYNCIAWAAGDCNNFWWPEYGYWPPGVSTDLTLDSFIAAFQTLGYQTCNGPEYEPNFIKIVNCNLYQIRSTNPCSPSVGERSLDQQAW